ncbi:MAG: type III pantothenate kinase [Gammaproteobacteria bacterium]|nr:type III pantothenate kinase [Gammaproteobacteria bacterium]
MILTIDIGNSRIKRASWRDGKIVNRGVIAYQLRELTKAFDQLFLTMEKPAAIYAVCVAGNDVSLALAQWCALTWQMDVDFLKTEKHFNNITNAYKNPAQHGVDRWAAVVAAFHRSSGRSVCIISAGTAVTFDFINKNGQHLGGYILPSYAIMHAALMTDTAEVNAPYNVQSGECGVPNNTEDAVNQGLHKLLQAGIRELCRLAQAELEGPVQIVLTGGFAEVILSYPDMPAMQCEPDLVMMGLLDIKLQCNNYLE